MSEDLSELPTHGRREKSHAVESEFEMLVETPNGSWHVPLGSSRVKIGSAAGTRANDIELDHPGVSNRQGVLQLARGRVFFASADPSSPSLVNGRQVVNCELNPGDQITFAGCRLELVKTGGYVASLVGYSQPHLNTRWDLVARPHRVGTDAQAEIQLEDEQIAGLHAVLQYGEGGFQVAPLENNLVRVNGNPVSLPSRLNDGDLVQVGGQYLRYRQVEAKSTRAPVTQDATIVFCDIWEYSGLFKERPLELVVEQMNEFYRELGRAIQAREGVVMRYVGDAILASFSGQDHELRSVWAAVELHRRTQSLNQGWKARGLPPFRIGVGINTGEVMLGDLGYSGKLEFSALGADVNLASRIEKLTREHQAHVLLGEATARAVADAFVLKSLGEHELKGYWKPMEIFQVVDAKR